MYDLLDIQGEFEDIVTSIDFYQKLSTVDGIDIDTLRKRYLSEYLGAYKSDKSSRKSMFRSVVTTAQVSNSDSENIHYCNNGVYLDEDISSNKSEEIPESQTFAVEYVSTGVILDEDSTAYSTNEDNRVSDEKYEVDYDDIFTEDFGLLFDDNVAVSPENIDDWSEESNYEDYNDSDEYVEESDYNDYEDSDEYLEVSDYSDYADYDECVGESDYAELEEPEEVVNTTTESSLSDNLKVNSAEDFSDLFNNDVNKATSGYSNINNVRNRMLRRRVFDDEDFISSKDLATIEKVNGRVDSGTDNNPVVNPSIDIGDTSSVSVDVDTKSTEISYKDVRDFVKKNPGCTIAEAKVYFSSKDIQKALVRVKIVEKKNRLYVV